MRRLFNIPKKLQMPSIERQMEIENYANSHQVVSNLNVNFTDSEGIIDESDYFIKFGIKVLFADGFRGSNSLTTYEVDMIFKAWKEALEKCSPDLIIYDKYKTEEL